MIDISTQPLMFTNAKIFGGSGWSEPTWYEALLIEDGLITKVGTNDEVLKAAGNINKVMDLEGALVLPGLCDAHLHLAAGGQSLTLPNLDGMKLDGVRETLLSAKERLDSPDVWLEAFNWDSNICQLNAKILDEIVPEYPVVVHQRDLHCCCCNTLAMKLARLQNPIKEPPGGKIGRFEDGSANGLFYESAVEMILKARPQSSDNEHKSFIINGISYLTSLGITAVCEVLNKGYSTLYRELDKTGKLDIDIDAWLRIEDWDGKSQPYKEGIRYKECTLKLFLDGSFGSRTAALFEPYLDAPDKCGTLFYTDGQLLEIFISAIRSGWRLALHAIGDRAVDQAMRILAKVPKVDNTPHRIEHSQLLPPQWQNLLKECPVMLSIQPVHLLDDQVWLSKSIGVERCKRAFIWRSVLNAGVELAIGSDWPVASPEPKLNLQALIKRAAPNEAPFLEFDINEALTPVQSIRAMSYGFAKATGWEKKRGCVKPGMQADLTIYKDYSPTLDDWSNARLFMTISKGKILYQSN